MFVQSHTPFADMKELHDKTVLVVGGDHDKCQLVAQKYGFKAVVTPGDIVTAYPEVWPFTKIFAEYYRKFAKPLPKPIHAEDPANSLKIDAIFVYNDPRDWGLDTTIITDLLLSREGIMGTLSSKNGDKSLHNNGYQQDSQPKLYFSNPDLWWAAKYHLPRLGQGGFREALEGVWAAITGGPNAGVQLQKKVIGKPHHETYEFAEKRLRAHRNDLYTGQSIEPLRKVYMVGDNPGKSITHAYHKRRSLTTAQSLTLLAATHTRAPLAASGHPSCSVLACMLAVSPHTSPPLLWTMSTMLSSGQSKMLRNRQDRCAGYTHDRLRESSSPKTT